MRDLTFYPANTPPLPLPRLDIDITLYLYRPIEAADLPSLLVQKLDGQDRLTEVCPQRRQRRFPSIPRVCHFDVLLLIDTIRGHASESTANSLAVLWTLAPFLSCHGDLELDSLGVSTKIILVEWPWLGGLYAR